MRGLDPHPHQGDRDGSLWLATQIVYRELAKVARGPVVFEGEVARAPVKRTLAYVVLSSASSQRTLGDAKTLSDLDLVAIDSGTSVHLGDCNYTDGKSNQKTIGRYKADAVVTVYDRKTGAQLGRKTFPHRHRSARP